MNLAKKKILAAKALKVGKNRIIFNREGLNEIKEAITRQDIKSLKSEGIISIKPVKGRRKIKRRKTKKGPGKIKKKVKKRKQSYVKITRKLRRYLKELKDSDVIKKDLYRSLRRRIRMRDFKSLMNIKEYLKSVNINFDKQHSYKKFSENKIKKKNEKIKNWENKEEWKN